MCRTPNPILPSTAEIGGKIGVNRTLPFSGVPALSPINQPSETRLPSERRRPARGQWWDPLQPQRPQEMREKGVKMNTAACNAFVDAQARGGGPGGFSWAKH